MGREASLLCLALLMSIGFPANAGAASSPAASASAGAPLSRLSAEQLAYFQDGLSRFEAIDSVGGAIPGETDSGLGPTFNTNSCGSCHAQPSAGGTSPSTNPQIAAATANGATNSIPDFLSAGGPVREVRFPFLPNSNGIPTSAATMGRSCASDGKLKTSRSRYLREKPITSKWADQRTISARAFPAPRLMSL
jgi:hypothetical protein